MLVKVCDAMCGAGKTSAAIRFMNTATDRRFLFITPRLTEVQRICEQCGAREFAEPKSFDSSGKMGSLVSLLRAGRNVASTHALFRRYDQTVADLIREGGYTLILDEVLDVVDMPPIHPHDVRDAITLKHIAVDDAGIVSWIDDGFRGEFSKYRTLIQNGNTMLSNTGTLLLWLFSAEVFESFREVYILTYMFGAQVQRCYYDLCGIRYEFVGTRKCGDGYEFCAPEEMTFRPALRDKIHILQNDVVNAVGDPKFALSASWFERNDCGVDDLRKNLYNVLRNKFGAPSREIMWTTYKEFRSKLSGSGFTRSFLECTCRATNDYAERRYLGYCVNVFMNPYLRNFFLAREVDVDQDAYALSEMIQWVWRSAIRNGEEIWLYAPSSRMRELFTNWVEEVSA